MHGVPPLAFDAALAAEAKAYADILKANDNGLVHSTEEQRTLPNQGENLTFFFSTKLGEEDDLSTTALATKGWYNEIKDYNFDAPGFSSKTGHFTQVIWKSTCRLGCGVADEYLVCRYQNAGNINNQGFFKENVCQVGGCK